jgi:enoyl-CoA hydratase
MLLYLIVDYNKVFELWIKIGVGGRKMTVLLQERFNEGQIVVLTLNRPEALNSMNTELGLALSEAIEELSYEPSVRVIVLTGAGERAFSTGGDFKERYDMTTEGQWKKRHRMYEEIARKFRQCPKPVIAAVNGYALGGGCELALSCDFVFASANAKFGLPEVSRGIIPGIGGTQTIGRFLPRGLALELLLTGRHMGTEEAFANGLVNKVVEPSALMETVLETCQLIAKNSPHAVRLAKKAFRLGIDAPLEEGVEIAMECYNQVMSHPDRVEGTRSFVEKRPAKFLNLT